MNCKDTQVIQVVLDGLNNMLKLAGQGIYSTPLILHTYNIINYWELVFRIRFILDVDPRIRFLE